MSYKLTEFYALSIPLFIPSMLYFHQNGGLGLDRSSLAYFYCSNHIHDEDMKPHSTSIHPYSPNSMTDKEAEYYWLQMSDFYYWPHITNFDNGNLLSTSLSNVKTSSVYHKISLLLYHIPNVCLTPIWCMHIITIP